MEPFVLNVPLDVRDGSEGGEHDFSVQDDDKPPPSAVFLFDFSGYLFQVLQRLLEFFDCLLALGRHDIFLETLSIATLFPLARMLSILSSGVIEDSMTHFSRRQDRKTHGIAALLIPTETVFPPGS